MALLLKDRIKETSTTSGTGTYTLGGAETGFEAFSVIGDGNTTYYCCTDGSDFEIGIGTYTLSGTTLARTTILQSSNSDAAVDWTVGATRVVFCTYPADKAVFLNASNQPVINGTAVTATAAELNILDGVSASATDINLIDGITNGTVIASKAIITDANKDITGGRNITISGEIDAATGDFSGAVDVAGATTVTTLASSGLLTANAKIDLNGTELILDADADTSITADTDDQIDVRVAGTDQITIKDGAISPVTDSDIDLGTTSLRYKDAFIDTVTTTGNVVVGGDLTITGDDLVMGTNTSGHILVADGTNFNPTAVGDLSEISTIANDDVFLAVDTSGGGLKKVARSTVVSGLATSSALSNVVEDTSPQLGGNLDTNSQNILIDDAHFIGDENGNEQIIFQTTSSAVNQLDITNAATGSGPTISSTGGDTNINLNLTPKGSGVVMIDGNVGIDSGKIDLKNGGTASQILFYCESSNAHAQTLQAAPHLQGATNTLLLPDGGNGTLLSTVSTATLTNKTLTAPKIADGGFIADANGNELVVFQTTGSAVNQLEITNNASGSNPILAATGGDTNIGIALTPKGTGEIVIGAGNLNYGGTAVTSTGAELNILDGVTSNATELNLIDGSSAGTIVNSKAVIYGSSGEVNATTLQIAGTSITSTAAELNSLDGITAVVGELNALDLGSTAVGTAIASKAVILDSNKDYTGIRNFNISGELQTANIGFTDGDNAITIADGGGITAANGITSTAASNTLGATSFNDANITNVGSIALDSIASDAGTGTAITFGAGNVPNTQTAGSQGGNTAPDFSQYTNFVWTLTSNLVLTDPGDEVAGQSGIFVFVQDGTGSRTLSHAADQYFVAGGISITLSTAANAIDIVPYFVHADGKIHLGAAQKAFAEA